MSAAQVISRETAEFWYLAARTCNHDNRIDLREEKGQLVCAECDRPLVRKEASRGV